MPIQEIFTSAGSPDPVKGNTSQASRKPEVSPKGSRDPEKKSDSIEVSEEARARFEAGRTGRFQAIREKILRGFYFHREVTEKVVDAMLKDLK